MKNLIDMIQYDIQFRSVQYFQICTLTPQEFFVLQNWNLVPVAQLLKLCLTLCHSMDCSTTGFPVLHYFLEFTQTHVHWVDDAIQPSYLLSPLLLLLSIFPSIRVFSSESALHIRWLKIGASASASVLPMNIQEWFPLGWTGWLSLQSKGLSRVFSNTTVQKHQFFGTQLSL